MSDERIEQQIDMKVALAENGFYVTWSEPVLVKSHDDTARSMVRAVAEGIESVMAAKRGQAQAPTDEAASHPDDPDAWRGETSPAPTGEADPVTQTLGNVLAVVNEGDKITYRIVRRSVVCSKPEEVLPAIARAEAAFKDLMKLRLEGALLEAD